MAQFPWPYRQRTTFLDLDVLLTKTLTFLDELDSAPFQGSESKDIVLRPGTPKEKKMSGQAYLLSQGMPQFFFHVTTAYAILRHNGLEIGKRDYMGAYQERLPWQHKRMIWAAGHSPIVMVDLVPLSDRRTTEMSEGCLPLTPAPDAHRKDSEASYS